MLWTETGEIALTAPRAHQSGPKGSPASPMLWEDEHEHTEISLYHSVSLNDLEAVLAHGQQGESVSTFPSKGFKSVDGM